MFTFGVRVLPHLALEIWFDRTASGLHSQVMQSREIIQFKARRDGKKGAAAKTHIASAGSERSRAGVVSDRSVCLDFKFNEIARLTRLKDKVLRRLTEGDLDRRPRLEAEGRDSAAIWSESRALSLSRPS